MATADTYYFSGHETFPFRYPWLKKGFDAVDADGDAFLRDDAIAVLGVGKNMVRSIRHWCLAAGIVQETTGEDTTRSGRLEPTAFGRKIFATKDGLDPFLEDSATLWLIHWQIASNQSRASTWHWTFLPLAGKRRGGWPRGQAATAVGHPRLARTPRFRIMTTPLGIFVDDHEGTARYVNSFAPPAQ
jgi:Protein of unknown function (DUF4007)